MIFTKKTIRLIFIGDRSHEFLTGVGAISVREKQLVRMSCPIQVFFSGQRVVRSRKLSKKTIFLSQMRIEPIL